VSSLTFILPASSTGVTTPGVVRREIVALIEALTPATESSVGYREHRHETQDLRDWADEFPESCFRRFSVRYTGDRDQPEVSNTDVEDEERDFEIVIAYPSTNRWGDTFDRDDVIDADANQVNHEVGTNSYGSITDCTMLTEGISREDGSPATFAVINLRAVFLRQQAA
jgi:hypothetical protein